MRKRLRMAGVAVLTVVVVALVVLVLAPEPDVAPPVTVAPVVHDNAPSALFVGDSFPAGSGAPSKDEGAACLAARTLGWTCNLDAQAGSGFVADGRQSDPGNSPLIQRLAHSKNTYLADIVVIDAGRNDRDAPQEQLKAAISTYLEAVRAAWPKAEIVVIEPYFMDTQAPVLSGSVLAHLRAATEQVEGHVLSPQAAAWILPGSDSRYLDAAGHRYIAQRLVAALRDIGLDDLEVTDYPTP